MTHFPARSKAIACTLTPADLQNTQAAWKKLLGQSMISRVEVPGGIRIVVDPRSRAALHRLIDVERECCRWITFELDGSTVTMTAQGEGEAAIRAMWM